MEAAILANIGELAALATAACWAISAMFFESAGLRVGSLTVNWLRLIIGFAMLCVAAKLLRGAWLPLDASLHAWWWLSVSGIAGFLIGDLCLFRAYVVLGPRLSSLIMSLAPPLTVLFGGWVLDEHLGPIALAGMTLTIVGIAWAMLDRSGSVRGLKPKRPIAGIFLAFGGAVGQAGGLVLSKLGMGAYHPLAATQIRVLAGIVGFSAVFFALRWWGRVGQAVRDRPAMRATTLGSIFGPFLGVTLSLAAVQATHAGVAASIMATTPILIIPLVWVVRGERVGWGGLVGTALAVGGVALLFYR